MNMISWQRQTLFKVFLVLILSGFSHSFDCSVLAQPPQAGEYSPAIHEVTEELDQDAPVRDGVKLKADIFRPKEEGKYPAILQITPYDKRGQAKRARKFASHGFVVVNVDSRGRYESGGEWDPFTPKHKTDGYDLVEWVAKQGWCTGKVGMYGLSYMGWTQWWTASQAPPSLKAIVPEVAPPDHFYNCPYQNGIFVCWMMDWAGAMSDRTPHSAGPGPYGGYASDREEAYSKLPYIDFDKTRNYKPTDWWRKWINQNTASDTYWKEISYQTPESYSQIQVPSLAITGWFDADFPGAPMNYLAMKKYGATKQAKRPRMVIGPWSHIINTQRVLAGIDYGEDAIIDWDGYIIRWFDYHLKGIQNGVLDDPSVHVFVMGRNKWKAVNDWPIPGTRFTKYYFHSQGAAGAPESDGVLSTVAPQSEPPDKYTYDPHDPTPSVPFQNGHTDGARDTSEAAKRNDVLVYQTDILNEDVEIVGPITANLFASTSAHDTDWMVRLVDVHPDGKAMFLAEGIMRARYRDPKKNGAFNPYALSSITPDQVYEYTIDFYRPTGNLFQKGHRIRVEISSSYYPYYLRNPNSKEDNIGLVTEFKKANQTIYHDSKHPSSIILPVIPQN